MLHTTGLAEPSLLALTSRPVRLIFSLYEHPSIVERVRRYSYLGPSPGGSALSAVIPGLPDIHAVVDRVAEIGSIDPSKVRRALLNQWLVSKTGVHQLESADVTMVGEDSMMAVAEDSSEADSEESDVNLLRAVYLLQHPSMSMDHTAIELISCVDDGDATVSVQQQLRAVRCLFMLTDITAVRRVSSSPRNWSDHLATLLYTSELRRLRVLPAGSAFEGLDKSGLVRALCRCRNSASGRVAACLAADFCVSDPQIWNAIISRLTASNLEVLLRPLPCHSREMTESVSELVRSWLNGDAVDLASAVRICVLLQSCPTNISEEVLRRCAVQFGRHGLSMCSLACTLMLPRDPSRVPFTESFNGPPSELGQGSKEELSEFVRSGWVLPITSRLASLCGNSMTNH